MLYTIKHLIQSHSRHATLSIGDLRFSIFSEARCSDRTLHIARLKTPITKTYSLCGSSIQRLDVKTARFQYCLPRQKVAERDAASLQHCKSYDFDTTIKRKESQKHHVASMQLQNRQCLKLYV